MSSQPVVHLSKAQRVAEELLERILAMKSEVEKPFATEAELLQQFAVSRPTLREGIRILEAQGLFERRPGPGGGLVILSPSLEALAHSLSIYLRFNDVPFMAILKSRELIEPALAAEAAAEGSEADFFEMADSIKRMESVGDDQEAFIAENRVFHGIVARASGNKVLETFWGMMSLLAHGEHHGLRYTFGNRQHVIAAHQRILKACRRRDSAAAAQAMAEHVGELEHLVRNRYKHLLKQPARVRVRRGSGS